MKKQAIMPKTEGLNARAKRFFGSERFWYIVLGFFVICSVWVATTSLYPMAFDEQVHFGTIKAYSEVWNPFSLTQKSNYDSYGAITADPSYLFHYLMSFPYRLINVFTHNQAVVVVLLRLLNVCIFTLALIVFRKALFAARVSKASAHVALAVFVLIPVVPLMAGQINYDNLFLFMTAVLLLSVLKFRSSLRFNNSHFLVPLSLALIFALLGSIVKYAFLPIAFGAGIYVFIELFLAFRRDGKQVFMRLITSLKTLGVPILVGLAVLTVISAGLFSQRYIANVARYGAPVPDCAKVLNTERCMSYGPWQRNFIMSNNNSNNNLRSLPYYTATHFAWGMWTRLYFTLAGPTNDHATRTGLIIPSYTAIILVAFGSVLVIIFGKLIFSEHPEFWLFLIIAVFYVGTLISQVYGDYRETGNPIAINGRYLLPILPGLGAIFIAAYSKFIRSKFKGIFASVVLILLIQGGGAITYMVRSEPSWFWPNPVIQNATNTARNILSPFTIGE